MNRSAAILGSLAALALICFLAWGVWMWCFCRFYVPAGCMAVVTAKSGDDPAPGTLLVERGQKGIWRDVLAEGRHFLDPVNFDVKIVKATVIPLGKVGVVTAKVGKELPPGEIIAPDRSSKGVWRDVLGPGVYRLNPEGYSIEIIDAMSIPVGYVGIVTSQTGKKPAPGNFAAAGEQGVLKDVLQPGLYYINPVAHRVNIFEIGMNQVTMSGSGNASAVVGRNRVASTNTALNDLEEKALSTQNAIRVQSQLSVSQQHNSLLRVRKPAPAAKSKRDNGRTLRRENAYRADKAFEPPSVANGPGRDGVPLPAASQIFGVSRAVEFPSRDGFKITIDMTVEFELMPENVAKIYLLYGDLPQVVEKIIMPQVLSASRLKGSSYRAQDFIMGEGRETFQRDLKQELERSLAAKRIIVHNAIIRNVEIPMNILKPIRAVSIAREQNLTNQSLQETAKKLAELNIETELIEQKRREVTQETQKIVAAIAAERDRNVAEIRASAELEAAKIQLKRSEILAKTEELLGSTKVKAAFLVDNERALGEAMRAQALGGGKVLADLKAVEALNPRTQTRVIYAGPGTLWTDLKSATLPLTSFPREKK